MANEQNLVSLADRPTSEQREIARKGGLALGEIRRKRMALRELTSILINASAWEHQQGYPSGSKTLMCFVWHEQQGLRETWYSNL